MEQAVLDALDSSIESGNVDYVEEEPLESSARTDELSVLMDALGKLEGREKRIRIAYQDGIDTLEEYKEFI